MRLASRPLQNSPSTTRVNATHPKQQCKRHLGATQTRASTELHRMRMDQLQKRFIPGFSLGTASSCLGCFSSSCRCSHRSTCSAKGHLALSHTTCMLHHTCCNLVSAPSHLRLWAAMCYSALAACLRACGTLAQQVDPAMQMHRNLLLHADSAGFCDYHMPFDPDITLSA